MCKASPTTCNVAGLAATATPETTRDNAIAQSLAMTRSKFVVPLAARWQGLPNWARPIAAPSRQCSRHATGLGPWEERLLYSMFCKPIFLRRSSARKRRAMRFASFMRGCFGARSAAIPGSSAKTSSHVTPPATVASAQKTDSAKPRPARCRTMVANVRCTPPATASARSIDPSARRPESRDSIVCAPPTGAFSRISNRRCERWTPCCVLDIHLARSCTFLAATGCRARRGSG